MHNAPRQRGFLPEDKFLNGLGTPVKPIIFLISGKLDPGDIYCLNYNTFAKMTVQNETR
jgi:hypothetical protein